MTMTQGKRRIRCFLSACLTALLLLSPGGTAMAEEYGVIRNPNGGSYVNVRSWPSYDAEILLSLSVGTTVQVTGTSGSWHTVWVNGMVGYINKNFVIMQNSGGTTGTSATVRSGPLNLRETPSMQAGVIMQLATGTRVEVASQSGAWTQVVTSRAIGWVVSSYLSFDGGSGSSGSGKQPVNTPDANATIRTVNGGNLNLREWGGSGASILGSYANNSRVQVIAAGTSWSRVRAGNQYGYMATQYLQMDGGSSGGGSSSGSGYDAYVSNSSGKLNLRAQPNENAAILGQYSSGTAVKVLGVGTEWLRVRVGGVEGYMVTRYVSITGAGATPNKTVSGGAGGYVNLRSGASYDDGVIMRVNNGSAATVVIPYATWSKVIVRQGSGYTSGFMLNSFLR